jgi:hypothetical protein
VCAAEGLRAGPRPSADESVDGSVRRCACATIATITVAHGVKLGPMQPSRANGVTMSSEFNVPAETFGIGLDEMEWLTTNAMKSAFAPFDERLEIINEAVKPGYARLRACQARVLAGGSGHVE